MPATTPSSLTGNRNIDGLLWVDKWAVTNLTFGFPTLASQFVGYSAGSEPYNNFAPLDSVQQALVRTIFGWISGFANLTFTELTDGSAGNADLRFGNSDAPSTAYAYLPDPDLRGGDSWFNTSSGKFAAPVAGTYGYVGFIHEIGHALGLKHPHETDGNGITVPVAFDSMEYTVMSYRSYIGADPTTGYTNGIYSYAQTPMMFDIAALQSLYGANFTASAGNDRYSWNPDTGQFFINGTGQTAPGFNRVFQTIWDGGGTDLYDFSLYTTGVQADLRPGEWTTTSTAQLANLGSGHVARGNIANALLFQGDPRSLIENAMGGSGDDSILGNQAANSLWGGAGNDMLDGGDGDDLLFAGTGSDLLLGGTGDDALLFGASLDASDQANGGTGSKDQLGIQGDYSLGLTLGTGNLVNIETLVFLSGTDTRFGDPGGSLYSYNITTIDANVAAGQQLTVNYNGLVAGENVTFNGSAETDGFFFVFAGKGNDTLTGGAGADAFFFGLGAFSAADTVNGGAGQDQLGLRGDYTVVFSATTMTSVESLVLLSGKDLRFGPSATGYHYDVTLNDANVDAGRLLTVTGNALQAGETILFDGSAETDGTFRIISGTGDDVLKGGAGIDLLYGNLGADSLTGNGGNDIFLYRSILDSTTASRDTVADFGSGDRIDLATIDAISGTPGNDAFTFIGSDAFHNVAGELRAVNNAGNVWTVQADVDGDGVADLEILLMTADAHPIVSADFTL